MSTCAPISSPPGRLQKAAWEQAYKGYLPKDKEVKDLAAATKHFAAMGWRG